MIRHRLHLLLLSFLPSLGSAQTNSALTESELQAALEIIQPTAAAFLVPGGDQRRPVVSSNGQTSADGETRLAEISQFEYHSGKQRRYVVNLEKRELVSSQEFDARAPKLAASELEEAQTLARESPRIRELYTNAATPDDIVFYFMVPAIANREDLRFGKRIAVGTYHDKRRGKAASAAKIEVNLTDRTVSPYRIGERLENGEGANPQLEEPGTSDANLELVPPRQIIQEFPIRDPGYPGSQRTSWRIQYGIEKHAGTGEILYIRRADFRPRKSNQYVQVLGDSRLAEMFVPYHAGSPRFYDIAMGFQLETLGTQHLGPECVGPSRILEGKVALELHDNHVLWLDTAQDAKRVEELHLWSVYAAGNYRYIMLYTFRDDGQVGFRVGATAHNYHSDSSEAASHLHVGVWRLSLPLGDTSSTTIQQVRHITSPQLQALAQTRVEPFNNGIEGGLVWKAHEHTTVRFQSESIQNGHQPPSYIAYDVIAQRTGNIRTYGTGEEWTHADFWVTRDVRSDGFKLLDVRDIIPTIGENPKPISDQPVVLWHISGLVHRARDEDFGKVGSNANEGVALTAWAGFELKPRNFLSDTPFYPPAAP